MLIEYGLLFTASLVGLGFWWFKLYPSFRQRRALRRAKIWRIGELPENTLGRLIGTVRPPGDALCAPISGRECVCWGVSVGMGNDDGETIFIREQKAVRFVLEDDSGRVIIEPNGAGLEGLFGSGVSHADGSSELDRKNALKRKSGWDRTERERAFLAERADRFNKSWRRTLLDSDASLTFHEAIVEVGEVICVAGMGIREGDPDARASEGGYRTAPPTRLRFTSSPKLRLLITDAPIKEMTTSAR